MRSDLATSRLRASSAFMLVGFDQLEPAEQERLAALREARDFFGILKPVNPLLPAKSVSRDAALLFLTLQRAQRIPALIASIFGKDGDLTPLVGLLADGVLEVEHDGAFVSGRAAMALFSASGSPTVPEPHPFSKLSWAAIQCAASYEGLDSVALAQKVYAFGRLPCTERIRDRFARDADLLSFLAAEPGIADLLASEWTAAPNDAEQPWLNWRTRREAQRLGFKLYISARLDGMPRLFGMTLRAFRRARCHSFKIGRHAEGVCRPDKMVGYFASLEQLRECASLIEEDLAASDVPPSSAHGVPFTADIDAAGFLGWGMDPPELARATDSRAESWRGWIASRVAVAVLSAKSTASHKEIVPFVLQRLEIDGIDPGTWAPNLAIWRAHAANPADVA
jgi:hypothetical protein